MSIVKQILATDKFKLSKPIKVGDNEIGELSLPFSELRGRDIVEAQKEFEAINGGPVELLETSKDFQAFLIAKMAKVPYDTILDELPVSDFNALTLAVYRFLLYGV